MTTLPKPKYYKFTYYDMAPLANAFKYKMDGGWETPIPSDIPLEMCAVGYHVVTSDSLIGYASRNLWEVEVDDGILTANFYPNITDKLVTRNIRFVREIPEWTWEVCRTFLAKVLYDRFRTNYYARFQPLCDELLRISQKEGAIFTKWDLIDSLQDQYYPFLGESLSGVLTNLSYAHSRNTTKDVWKTLSVVSWHLPSPTARKINSELEERLFRQ